jgi:uncharacterized protein YndB with AHSA1/START domain
MDDLTSIHVDEFLPHPAARVWRALTDPELIAKWLMQNDFKPVVGHRFSFTTDPVPQTEFDGVVHCEVLEIEPERLLRISWRGGPTLSTTVTWTLEPEGTGTRLFLAHEGFDPDSAFEQVARRAMGGGWPGIVARSLTRCLADLP